MNSPIHRQSYQPFTSRSSWSSIHANRSRPQAERRAGVSQGPPPATSPANAAIRPDAEGWTASRFGRALILLVWSPLKNRNLPARPIPGRVRPP